MARKRSTQAQLLPRVLLATVAVTLVAADALGGSFPGPNGRLVFDRDSRIWTVNPDGSGETPITDDLFTASEANLSADGNRVVFRYNGNGGYGIWVVNANGTQPHQVTTEPEAVAANDGDPTWSPDGNRIAFVRGGDLMVMNADGSGTTNLTAAFTPGVSQPSWSPAGDRIAFVASSRVHLVDAGGSTPQQLQTVTGAHDPSWSPDAARIAYGTLTEVRTIGANGTGDGPVTGGLREVWDLAWSPDGTRIAFINDPAGPADSIQERLYMVNADGTGAGPVGTDTGISLDWGVPSTLQMTLADLPDPKQGVSVNVDQVSGTVKVGIPAAAARASGARASQKGIKFVPLTEAEQVPVGSFLDTRKGTVALQSARDRAGTRQTGRFLSGLFQVRQSKKRSAKGLTDLVLKGSSFRSCRAGSGKTAGAALSRRRIRRLRANARGRFRTSGQNSSATVRGTIWDITDRCDGTLTKVRRGRVVVRDFRRKKSITLTSGKSYLAKARR
jgi:WD40-like Beta Propeller Repeat